MTATAAQTTMIGGASSPPNAPAGHGGAGAYLRTRVMSASPQELRLLLLEGAIKFARQGRDGMLKKDYEAQYLGVSQCRDIIFELLTTIRAEVDPDLTARVKGLYTFMYNHLTEASFEKNVEKLDKVIELLDFERETWVMVMQKLAEERGKGNAPSAAPAATVRQPVVAPTPGTPRPAFSVQG